MNWVSCNAWIAHIDVLGFKFLLENDAGSIKLEVVKSKIDEIITQLKGYISDFEDKIDFLFFADTFVIYSKSEKVNDYPALISVTKRLMNRCIYLRLPVRGAISYGSVVIGHDKRILLGKAFLESHIFGEDQNWIGMILTPSACMELDKYQLQPILHGFINKDIPLRKCKEHSGSVYAYKFVTGSTNFNSHLLLPLNEMMKQAPSKAKIKYENTIKFIKNHYDLTKS